MQAGITYEKKKVDTVHPRILFYRINKIGGCGDIKPTKSEKMASRQRDQKEQYSSK